MSWRRSIRTRPDRTNPRPCCATQAPQLPRRWPTTAPLRRSEATDPGARLVRSEPHRSHRYRSVRAPDPTAHRVRRQDPSDLPERRVVSQDPSESPPNSVRNRPSARDVLDFTVPRAIPNTVAVSASESSATNRHPSTARSSSRRVANALTNSSCSDLSTTDTSTPSVARELQTRVAIVSRQPPHPATHLVLRFIGHDPQQPRPHRTRAPIARSALVRLHETLLRNIERFSGRPANNRSHPQRRTLMPTHQLPERNRLPSTRARFIRSSSEHVSRSVDSIKVGSQSDHSDTATLCSVPISMNRLSSRTAVHTDEPSERNSSPQIGSPPAHTDSHGPPRHPSYNGTSALGQALDNAHPPHRLPSRR